MHSCLSQDTLHDEVEESHDIESSYLKTHSVSKGSDMFIPNLKEL